MQIACCPDHVYVATPREKAPPPRVRPSYRRVLSGRSRGGRFQWVSSTPSAGRTVFGVETLCLRDHWRSPLDSGVRGRPDRPLPTEIRSGAAIQRATVAIYLLTS